MQKDPNESRERVELTNCPFKTKSVRPLACHSALAPSPRAMVSRSPRTAALVSGRTSARRRSDVTSDTVRSLIRSTRRCSDSATRWSRGQTAAVMRCGRMKRVREGAKSDRAARRGAARHVAAGRAVARARRIRYSIITVSITVI